MILIMFVSINFGIIGAVIVDKDEACEKIFDSLWTMFIIKTKNTYFACSL